MLERGVWVVAPVTPDSMRSISASLMRCSLWFWCCSRVSSACSSATDRRPVAGNGDPGEGLVDVHAIELFSVGVEADHPLLAQERADRLQAVVGLQFQPPQETITTDGQQQRSETLVQAIEQLVQVRQQRARVMAVSTMPFSTAQ